MGSLGPTSKVKGRVPVQCSISVNMVVQNTCEDNHEDTTENSDTDHRNTNGNTGVATEHSENGHTEKDDNSDEEPDADDMSRLKDLVPNITGKDNVTQLDIILEAIRYIDSLQNKLADKIESGEIVPIEVVENREEEDS